MSSDSDTPTVPSGDDAQAISTLLWKATIAVIHEATLQDLLRYSNDAVHRLLEERNDLLYER